MKLKYFLTALIAWLILPIRAAAHPMPNSILLLDLKSNGIAVELQLPLTDLQLAMGKDWSGLAEDLIRDDEKELADYILAHVHPIGENGASWEVKILGLQTGNAEQTATGVYQELRVHLWMQPPQSASLRKFTLNYDVIVHQVVTHKILVSVRQDWMNGKVGEAQAQVGVIGLDARSNTIPPLSINLEEGSAWKGFASMVNLGMRHISEGTDHLLFLLALLLSAPLIAEGSRWARFGGTKYSLIRLIKITTAFTLGHSVTLLAGALGWLRLPQQPVEIIIAVSILVTAIHALRPLFPGKEIFVASSFGLIHGLAFATIISGLQLEAGRMALSILGFNLGIELMQLFVILMTMPWLLLISNLALYKWTRIALATFAAAAALAWIAERSLQEANVLSASLFAVASHGNYFVAALAGFAIAGYMMAQLKRKFSFSLFQHQTKGEH
jgi:hypothetical protein